VKPLAAVLAVAVLALVAGASARAGLLTGDPRSCSYHSASECARAAALTVAKRALARRTNVAVWTGTMACEQPTASVLRWNCRAFHLGEVTTVLVTFAKTRTGWARRVAFPP
jgi:hypothetical protein